MRNGDWTIIARLLRPQGRKGELLADMLTDFPEKFAERSHLFLAQPNTNGSQYTLEAHWFPVGRNDGRVVLQFAGVDSINAAELLKGYEVLIPAEERAELEEDENWISDLIGCEVVHNEHTIGTVIDVHFSEGTKAESVPLLVLERAKDGDELLIPFAKSYLKSVDLAEKRIEMQLPEGLLEING